jgi:arginase
LAIVFVGIPFYTLAEYRGMAEAVGSLRQAGILNRLRSADSDILDLGDVNCPIIDKDHGPKNLQNWEEFLQGTRNIKDMLSHGLDKSKLTFCLGGECAFIIGTLAGLKTVHQGRPGMVWMDAHGDFNTPETSPSGFIGGMGLALACGRGPKLSPEIEASRPLLDEEHVVHIGSRSLDPGEDKALLSSVKVFPAEDVKMYGARDVARQAARQLDDSSDWIIAHLDVDVFDPSIMPGVNFPEPGGLASHDILEIFRALQSTGKLKVVDLTAYNPFGDTGNRGKSFLVDLAPKLLNTV